MNETLTTALIMAGGFLVGAMAIITFITILNIDRNIQKIVDEKLKSKN